MSHDLRDLASLLKVNQEEYDLPVTAVGEKPVWVELERLMINRSTACSTVARSGSVPVGNTVAWARAALGEYRLVERTRDGLVFQISLPANAKQIVQHIQAGASMPEPDMRVLKNVRVNGGKEGGLFWVTVGGATVKGKDLAKCLTEALDKEVGRDPMCEHVGRSPAGEMLREFWFLPVVLGAILFWVTGYDALANGLSTSKLLLLVVYATIASGGGYMMKAAGAKLLLLARRDYGRGI